MKNLDRKYKQKYRIAFKRKIHRMLQKYHIMNLGLSIFHFWIKWLARVLDTTHQHLSQVSIRYLRIVNLANIISKRAQFSIQVRTLLTITRPSGIIQINFFLRDLIQKASILKHRAGSHAIQCHSCLSVLVKGNVLVINLLRQLSPVWSSK